MNSLESDQLEQRFRKAAILLASLDDSLAEQLLAEMPSEEAASVRVMMTQLDEFDAAEQDEVVSEFHRSREVSAPPSHDGVELDVSPLAQIEQDNPRLILQKDHLTIESLKNLSDAEANSIVQSLSDEHPQTMALVVSRLSHQAAGKILPLFSPDLQDQILSRLAELDPADESSAQIVESYLQRWVQEQRHRRDRMAAGTELVQKILENTPAEDRAVITGRIGRPSPQPATSHASGPPHTSPASAPRNRRGQLRRPLPYKRFVKPEAQEQAAEVEPGEIEDPILLLESAEDASLLAALTNVDKQIVTLALAGASERLLDRVLKNLPRRRGQRLKAQLRNVGPTRLSDIIDAQQQLAQYVRQHRQ